MEETKTTAAQPVIDSKIPEGPVAEKWTNYKAHQKLVNPANKRKLDIIVVGTGLALKIVETFLTTPFSNDERHIRRIHLIEE